MCGIAGLISANQSPERRQHHAEAMAASLRHRGPDDSGVWLGEAGVALAHRRLAILDLSERGHQPMLSRSGHFALTYNGEIYNFQALREQLRQEHGAEFTSDSDTEVLLLGIEHWGVEQTLRRLNGMFAFALWDRRERRLVLARDRMGEKPLYYAHIGNALYFASEIRAIAAATGPQLCIDRAAVAALLQNNCIPAPLSIFEQVRKLEPAHLLEIVVEGGGGTVRLSAPRPYWKLPVCTDALMESGPDAVEQTHTLLRDSIRMRMISDVPVGAFLSGGVDSTLVVGIMQSLSRHKVRTFTVGFESAAFDESRFARPVAEHLGTEHTELFVTQGELLRSVNEMPRVYCEPFSDPSQLPTYLVAALTRQHVTVVLSGDGGDEVFGGYDRYAKALKLWGRMRAAPSSLRRPLAHVLRDTDPEWMNQVLAWSAGPLGLGRRGRTLGEKLVKAGELLSTRTFEQFYALMISQWQHPETVVRPVGPADGPAVGPGAAALAKAWGLHDLPPALSLLRRMMVADQRRYLPDDILVKVDRSTMAVSLESRIPLLDHRLVELSARLPDEMLVRGSTQKWVLKELLDRYVPRALVERPKMGFGVPLGEWLRGPLQEWAGDLLSESTLRSQDIFAAEVVAEKWNRHLAGVADYAHDLWPILNFQGWFRHWRSTLFDQT